jgi:hypothetical protein
MHGNRQMNVSTRRVIWMLAHHPDLLRPDNLEDWLLWRDKPQAKDE